MSRTRSLTRAAAGGAIAALAITGGVPALAGAVSVPGWRLAHRSTGVDTSVLATARHEAWAFGFNGPNGGPAQPGTPSAEHWIKGRWRSAPLPPAVRNMIFAASATSAGNVWAIANFGGYVLHWNGRHWLVSKHVTGSGTGTHWFSGITAIGRKDVWIFGSGVASGLPSGLGTYHFDGRRWHQDATATADHLELGSAGSAADIWAIGTAGGIAGIYHFNGKWSRVHASALVGLTFVDVATTPGQVWVAAATGTGRALLLELRGGHWTRLKLPWQVQLLGSLSGGRMAPDGSGGVWMVAASRTGNWLIHRSASGHWSRMQAPGLSVARFPASSAFIAAGPGGVWAHGRI